MAGNTASSLSVAAIKDGEAIASAMPLEHIFSDGVYLRIISIPKDMFVCGHVHKTTHLNVLLAGEMVIKIGDETLCLKSGDVFEANSGTYKMVLTKTDCRIMNIIPTDLDDIDAITEMIIDKELIYSELASIMDGQRGLLGLMEYEQND